MLKVHNRSSFVFKEDKYIRAYMPDITDVINIVARDSFSPNIMGLAPAPL